MHISNATKLKVGFTTVFGLILLFGSIFWLKQYNPMMQRDTLTAVFTDAAGIASGDPVTLAGIRVGAVKSVDLDDNNRALVSFTVLRNPTLYSDARFAIRDVGLMGDKALFIFPGKKEPALDTSVTIRGESSTSINELIIKSDSVLSRLNNVGEKLERDLDISKITESFESTLKKLKDGISTFEEIAKENREPLNNTIVSLKESSSKLDSFIEGNDDRLSLALESFKNTSDKLSSAIDDMESLSTVADTLSQYLGSGEGTLGKLVKSEDFYDELRRTNAHIDSFINDFQANPGKYTKDMQFKLRLF